MKLKLPENLKSMMYVVLNESIKANFKNDILF